VSLYYAQREGKRDRGSIAAGRRAGVTAAAGEPLIDRLASLLPAAVARLMLVAPGAEALADGLAARGFTAAATAAASLGTATATQLPRAPSDQGWEAVLLLACGHDAAALLAPQLEPLRAAMAERGQLAIAAELGTTAAAGTTDPRALTIALSEHGFVVLRQEPLDDNGGALARELWTARREAFRVREYQPGDESQILPIFEGSFFVPRSRERWSWEYRENPYGNLCISEAFAEDGQLVAHYAGFPVRFRLPGRAEPVIALHVGDTMTLPGVRHVGRGPTSLLGRTVRHFYARFCSGRVAFNYGFNTGNIQRFSMAFVGAQRLEDLPFHVLPLPAPALAATDGPLQRWLPTGLHGWRCERVESFDARFDELFARVAGDYGMLVERDARYLDWRYRRQPGGEYRVYACSRRDRLVGWSVVRRRGDALFWGDALFDPRAPQAVGRLLAHALAQPEHGGVTHVETWATARPAWWRPLLRSVGFAERPEPQGLGIVFVPFEVDPGELMRARLYYTMGDSDLF
jgi:hypothetical protein